MIFVKKTLKAIVLAALLVTVFCTVMCAYASTVSVSGYPEPTANGGLFGKTANEYASILTGRAKYSITMTTTDGDFSSMKYFVIDLNFAPDATDSTTTITQLSSSDNLGITFQNAFLENDAYTPERWNHVRMIVEDSDYETMVANGKSQAVTLYVNGQLIGNEDVTHNTHSSDQTETQFKGLRVMFGKDDSVTTRKTYVSDFRTFESDTKPVPVVPVLTSGTSYSVDGNVISYVDDVTVADIKQDHADYDIAVFKNDSFVVQLADTDVISGNNAVVVKSSDNVYSYYTVAVSTYGETVYVNADSYDGITEKFTPGNVILSSVSGIGGKASDDTSLLVRTTSSSSDGYISWYWGTSNTTTTKPTNVTDYDWNKKAGTFTDYLVIEYSVYGIDITHADLTTDYGTAFTGNFCSYLTPGVWNRVRVVIDRTHTSTTDNTTKATVYVNGVPTTASPKVTNSLGDHYGTTSFRAKSAIRIRLKGGSPEGGAYVDDVMVYETKVLREDDDIELQSTDDYIVSGGNIYIPYASTGITSEMLSYDTEKASVVLYNADMTQTVESATEGCIIALQGKSSLVTDHELSYYDIYHYYTVYRAQDRYDLVTTNPVFALNGGSSRVITDTVFGNTSGGVTEITISSDGANNYCLTPWKTVNFGANYLVCALNFYPTDDTESIYFGTSQHRLMAAPLALNLAITPNKWNNIVMVYDIANDTSDIYVDGVLINENYDSKYVRGTDNNVRIIVEGEANSISYMDNVWFYESSTEPDIAVPFTFEDGKTGTTIVDNKENVIRLNESTTVSELKELVTDGVAKAYTDSTCTETLPASDTFTSSSVFVITTGDFKALTTYTMDVYAENQIVTAGKIDTETNTLYEGNDITFFASVTDGGCLAVAQYDTTGKMIRLVFDAAESTDIVSVDFVPDEIDGSTIKVFLFKGINNPAPLCENVTLTYRTYIDILFLGNSYSMDVSWHLGNIAAADDVLMNISVLNKGGCNLAYHYNNREGDQKELGINFWRNDVSLGTIHNLKSALEAYDWNYVIIQNSSTSEGIDGTSEENYQNNWAVAVPFAEYIHELEPETRILMHSTWSMETGYKDYVSTDEERDQILANMQTNSDRCISEINEALGLEGDDAAFCIYSSGIIDYARHYALDEDITINERTCTAGTSIFDTTYYLDGHVFDTKNIDVGDGSMLLSDEDNAAGKISLHRDGFHMSALGRYLIALNAYATLTGNTVTGNSFETCELNLDSSPGGYHVTETDNPLSGTAYQLYDALTAEAIALCQELVDEYQAQ